MFREETIKKLQATYDEIGSEIDEKFSNFNSIGERNNPRELFREMAFCILTPQSKAVAAWEAIENLTENGLLFNGSPEELRPWLRKIRFLVRKSDYIVEARSKYLDSAQEGFFDQFPVTSSQKDMRDWIVKNVKGYGYKEASHFMRNTGKGSELTILDRHILKILLNCNVIDKIPASITGRNYREIESRMETFSREAGIPLHHMDFVMWHEATGTIFK